MKKLRELLKDYEKRLNELTSPLYSDTHAPEVRAILIDTCKNAIEEIKQDIQEDKNEPECMERSGRREEKTWINGA